MFENNETVVMLLLVSQTNPVSDPVGGELSFVPINLHSSWPREGKRYIVVEMKRTNPLSERRTAGNK